MKDETIISPDAELIDPALEDRLNTYCTPIQKKKPKILVVYDHNILNSEIETYLKKKEYEVYTADNGVEGLEKCEEQHIDLIISDLKMTGMDADKLFRKAKELNRKIKYIIICFKGIESERIRKMVGEGAKFLTKSSTMYTMEKAIKGLNKPPAKYSVG